MINSGELYSYKEKAKELIDSYINCDQKNPAFLEILTALKTETFLVEDNYIDRDYLVDYSNFYATCHHTYERFCTRIHFFGKSSSGKFSFTKDVLSNLLKETKLSEKENITKQINSIYLGFIVLNPFKNGTKTIGRTCLAHYAEREDRKYYAIREYNVNLYGIPLRVNSMAFQEQDQTVAMCASIALWSAFNITGKKYQHPIPTPSEVTKLALSETSYSRNFPNEGLSAEQIAIAISKIGLNPLIIRTGGNRNLKSQIYAYLKAGIPIICGVSLFDVPKKGKINEHDGSFHAITINGFSFEGGISDISFKDGLRLYSNKMTKFYAHDDQLCPFTRMEFSEKHNQIGGIFFNEISTSWLSKKKDANKNKIARINSLIVPLYHKIRITYNDVLGEVQEYAKELIVTIKAFSSKQGIEFKDCFEWDIFLTDVNTFKNEILYSDYLNKNDILKKSYAKYLWRAKALDQKDGTVLFEIIFDSTDSKKNGISKEVVFYNPLLKFINENREKNES